MINLLPARAQSSQQPRRNTAACNIAVGAIQDDDAEPAVAGLVERGVGVRAARCRASLHNFCNFNGVIKTDTVFVKLTGEHTFRPRSVSCERANRGHRVLQALVVLAEVREQFGNRVRDCAREMLNIDAL